MGQAESNPVRNMDKRTARRTHAIHFERAIGRYRGGIRESRSYSEGVVWSITSGSSSCGSEGTGGGCVRVFVRKRPIHAEELRASEFDVVTVAASRQLVVVHDGRMEKDMRHLMMNHHSFGFDGVFAEGADNDTVYRNVASPLVRDAVEGGYASILMYGQTGSGKTYTMTAIYERASKELFASLVAAEEDEADRSGDSRQLEQQERVTVSFFELAGDKCADLLNGFEPARLMTGADGSVHAFPLVEVPVRDADELMAMVLHGLSVRATAATGVHDASSRSHAVLRVYVQPLGANSKEKGEGGGGGGAVDRSMAGGGGRFDEEEEGVLTLVDLAGSEHRIDSDHHTRQRRKEGAEINASLMALKSVVHARARGNDGEHLYRKSKLTMALKNSFVLPRARTAVIATVSPASKDTEHSLNTLRHACVMGGQQQQSDEVAGPHVGSGHSSHLVSLSVQSESLGEIDVAALSRAVRSEGGFDPTLASNGNEFNGQHSNKARGLGGKARGHGGDKEDPWEKFTGQKLAAALEKQKRANEKRARAAMAPAHRKLLEAARAPEVLRAPDHRQVRRLRRAPGGFASRREAEVHAMWSERGFEVLSFDDASGRVKVRRRLPFIGDDHDESSPRNQRNGGGGGDHERQASCFTVSVTENVDEALAMALAAETAAAAGAVEDSTFQGAAMQQGQGDLALASGGGEGMVLEPPSRPAPTAKAKATARPRAPRAVFRKLKVIAYSDETAPELFKAKQLARMLRQKGYSSEGVEFPDQPGGGVDGAAGAGPPFLQSESRNGHLNNGDTPMAPPMAPPQRVAPVLGVTGHGLSSSGSCSTASNGSPRRDDFNSQQQQQQQQQGLEMRIDPEDGNPYTWQDFVDEYGNGADCLERWSNASPWYPTPQESHVRHESTSSQSPVTLQRLAYDNDAVAFDQPQGHLYPSAAGGCAAAATATSDHAGPAGPAPPPPYSDINAATSVPEATIPVLVVDLLPDAHATRMERVRAARERKIQEEKRALLEKRARKEQRAAAAGGFKGSGGGGGGGDVRAEIAALEAQIAVAPSEASRHGLEKQLKAKRAFIVREQRKAEQRERERANEAAERTRQAEIERRRAEDELELAQRNGNANTTGHDHHDGGDEDAEEEQQQQQQQQQQLFGVGDQEHEDNGRYMVF